MQQPAKPFFISIKVKKMSNRVSYKQQTGSHGLKHKLDHISRFIGNTPLLPITGLHQNKDVKIFAKAEWKNLSGSVKARAAFNIIKNAISSGKLTENKILLDATSGNTGIAYAAIGQKLGIKVALCLPENASQERKDILHSLGAEIINTSPFGGTDEAQEKAAELAKDFPKKYFYASQYTNENNWKAHYYGTAIEIIRELPEISHFVAGLGTTGTFVGTSRRLKEYNPAIQAISLQPDVAMHGLEGWKHLETAIVPEIYDAQIADYGLEIDTFKAYDLMRKQVLGGVLSPSSAANIVGAASVADSIESGVIITILPDNADKYSEVIKKIM